MKFAHNNSVRSFVETSFEYRLLDYTRELLARLQSIQVLPPDSELLRGLLIEKCLVTLEVTFRDSGELLKVVLKSSSGTSSYDQICMSHIDDCLSNFLAALPAGSPSTITLTANYSRFTPYAAALTTNYWSERRSYLKDALRNLQLHLHSDDNLQSSFGNKTVSVGLVISRDGDVTKAILLEGSGSTKLDQTVMQVLQRSKGICGAPPEILPDQVCSVLRIDSDTIVEVEPLSVMIVDLEEQDGR